MSKNQDKIIQIIKNTLKLLSLSSDQFNIKAGQKEFTVQIDLSEEETGIYIGVRGESLTALQLLLSLMASQRLDKWVRVSVNVNDYKQRREESLQQLAENAAQKAIELNQEIIIPNLSSFERRVIHLYLQDNSNVSSESRGNPPHRQLFVIPQ